MAKLKTTATEEATNPEAENTNTQTKAETPPAPTLLPEPQPEKKEPAPVETPKPKKIGTAEIPAYATTILKAFHSYPELYIDSLGGTFTPDSPERLRGEAVLYKNPYYKP